MHRPVENLHLSEGGRGHVPVLMVGVPVTPTTPARARQTFWFPPAKEAYTLGSRLNATIGFQKGPVLSLAISIGLFNYAQTRATGISISDQVKSGCFSVGALYALCSV